jgi:hypothetical protein
MACPTVNFTFFTVRGKATVIINQCLMPDREQVRGMPATMQFRIFLFPRQKMYNLKLQTSISRLQESLDSVQGKILRDIVTEFDIPMC